MEINLEPMMLNSVAAMTPIALNLTVDVSLYLPPQMQFEFEILEVKGGVCSESCWSNLFPDVARFKPEIRRRQRIFDCWQHVGEFASVVCLRAEYSTTASLVNCHRDCTSQISTECNHLRLCILKIAADFFSYRARICRWTTM
jgi:hypothetical protein